MKELTKAEEQVMQAVWKLGEVVVKDVVNQFSDPRPAYTTVATVLKVLESKGFVDHRAVGNTYLYFPNVTKDRYSSFQMSRLVKEYFGNSFPKMAAFFARENNMDIQELDEMIRKAKDEFNKDQDHSN